MRCAGSHQKKMAQCKRIKSQIRKVAARAMRKEAKQELSDPCQISDSVFT